MDKSDVSTDVLVELIAYLRSFNDFKLQMVADTYEALQRSNAEARHLFGELPSLRLMPDDGDITVNVGKLRALGKALSHSSEEADG